MTPAADPQPDSATDPDQYDIAVLGGGPGGYAAAIRCAQDGKRTALVTAGPVGGVCLNCGCIPSKALIHGADLYAKCSGRHAAGFGIQCADVTLDYAKLAKKKERVVKTLRRGVEGLLKANGVTLIRGRGTLVSAHELAVATEDGTQPVYARELILATGSRPIEIPGFAFDADRVLSSTDALALTSVPEHLIVIGGGYIGLELGMCLAKCGAKVTVIELLDQLLPGFDADLVRLVQRNCRRRKISVHTSTRALACRTDDAGVEVDIEVKGEVRTIEGSHVLVTVGRRPNSAIAGLETLPIECDAKGFIVTDHAQRAMPGVYAIGDVAGEPMLAHKAAYEAAVAAAASAGREPPASHASRERVIPGVVFTDPELASAGLTEAEAAKAGREVIVGQFPYAALGRALTCGERDGLVKLVADAETGRLLGCAIAGASASTMIAEAVLAIELGATIEQFERVVHAHPTMPEALLEAAGGALGHAVHLPPQRTRKKR